MSKLLINEPALQVLPSLAVALNSLNAAVILQQIHYWIADSRAPEKEGRRWHYATFDQWLLQFPWMSLSTLKRLMANLEESGIVISKEFNASKGIRTKWYTIDYDVLQELELQTNTHSVKMKLPSGQNDTTIVSKRNDVLGEETTKETTKENNNNPLPLHEPRPSLEPDPVVVVVVEEMKKIGLTDSQSNAAVNQYGPDRIKEVIALTGQKYRENPPAFFAAALKGGWAPKPSGSYQSTPQRQINTDEERTRLYLEGLKANEQRLGFRSPRTCTELYSHMS